ncbi:MAG: 50S ribosomal protein L25 [Pseudomonadota bacterium]
MTEYKTLNAAIRLETGKCPAGRLRRDGKIPAVFYGKGQPSRNLTIDSREMKKLLFTDGGSHGLFQLNIEGEASPKVVLFKEYQVHPIKRTVIHADFYEVDVSRKLEIEVPLVVIGKPLGLDKGGVLQQIRHDILIKAFPTNLPESIEIDVSHLDLGDSIHVEDLRAPEGVEFVYDVNVTLVAVTAPRGSGGEEEVAAEEAEA